jgi:hypothetical protein
MRHTAEQHSNEATASSLLAHPPAMGSRGYCRPHGGPGGNGKGVDRLRARSAHRMPRCSRQPNTLSIMRPTAVRGGSGCGQHTRHVAGCAPRPQPATTTSYCQMPQAGLPPQPPYVQPCPSLRALMRECFSRGPCKGWKMVRTEWQVGQGRIRRGGVDGRGPQQPAAVYLHVDLGLARRKHGGLLPVQRTHRQHMAHSVHHGI